MSSAAGGALPLPRPSGRAAISARAVEVHLRAMLPEAHLLPLDELGGELAVGCVDGRRHGCVIGAPGGNAGLLVVLLAGLERVRGRPFGAEEVASLFHAYLDRFGAFYFHSDEPAVAALRRTLESDGAPGAGAPLPDAVTLALDPPAELRDAVLAALTDPPHVGCGHLRILLGESSMVSAPGNREVPVRPDLVREVLREAFRALWRGDPRMRFEILSGDHHEEGVLRIHAASTELMAACPHHGLHEFFVLHPDAVAWLETLHALFAAEAGWIPAREVTQLVEAEHEIATRVLETTLTTLAGGLPVFDVEVRAGPVPHRDGRPRSVAVALTGFVPEPPSEFNPSRRP
jgi:hypothetical protein